MKKLTVILCLPIFMAACQNNISESTTKTDSTTMIESTPADNTAGLASPGDTMSADAINTNTANSNNASAGSNSTTNSTSGNASGSSNINNTTSRSASPKDTRTTLEKTGHYNSDVSTPEPVNLDDKKLQKRRPQHTYGDTSIRAVPR